MLSEAEAREREDYEQFFRKVNVGEGETAALSGKKNRDSDPEEKNFPGEKDPNDVNQVHHVHPEEPDPDPFGDEADPELDAAIKLVEDVLKRCADEPGLLGSQPFLEACRYIRTESPADWVAIRVAIKRAKPSGVLLGDIDDATRPEREEGDPASVADELVELVREQAELFHGRDGACFATLSAMPHRTFRIESKAFCEWLAFAYYTKTSIRGTGCAISDMAIKSAKMVLTGIATHEGEERETFLRVGKRGDSYYMDLGSDDWSVIEITSAGWRHLEASPVTFWRSQTTRPLPVPLANGDLDRLWNYANIPPDSRPLVLAWMLETLRPETPFPILELVGSQGTAKSSTQARLRQVLDPNAVDLRSAPKSVEDLFVSAGANWLASFNNLSHLSPGTQDALCNLATGGGFAARTLYTNGDETLIDAKRPVILNGIVPTVTAQDLSDRVLHVELPEIAAYLPESEIEAGFTRDAPGIFGGLLDLFSATLAYLPTVRMSRPPRMADFARLGEAMLKAMGGQDGDFVGLYRVNRRDSVARGLEASPVAVAIRSLVDAAYMDEFGLAYEGTMGHLLERLNDHRDKSEAWPRSARGLGDAIRRQLPALAQIGIRITISKPGKHGVMVRIVAGEHGVHGEHRSEDFTSEKSFSDDDEAF